MFYNSWLKKVALIASAVFLTSCAELPQSRQAQTTSSRFANSLDPIRNRCTSYGFQPGTQAFAECVQKLDRENHVDENRQRQDSCTSLQKEVSYWCSDEPAKRGMGSLGANICGQKQVEVNQKCH